MEEPKENHPLKQARETLGLTQRQVAKKLGLPGNGNRNAVAQINLWECGLEIPLYDRAKRLAETLIFSSAEEVQELCQQWCDQHQEEQGKHASPESRS